MVIEMPLDLVADVTCLAALVCASSKAKRRMRSTPLRVNTDSWNTTSRSVPSNIRPPTDEYSPSVFSRTTTKSMSPGLRLASGVGMPGISRQGRKLTYWSKWRLNLIRHHRGPADRAVEDRVEARQRLEPVLGHHPAVLCVVVAVPVEMRPLERDAETTRGRLEHAQ